MTIHCYHAIWNLNQEENKNIEISAPDHKPTGHASITVSYNPKLHVMYSYDCPTLPLGNRRALFWGALINYFYMNVINNGLDYDLQKALCVKLTSKTVTKWTWKTCHKRRKETWMCHKVLPDNMIRTCWQVVCQNWHFKTETDVALYSAYKKKVIHFQRPIVLKSIIFNIHMWHTSKEQRILFPLVPIWHHVCYAWPSTLPLKMTM